MKYNKSITRKILYRKVIIIKKDKINKLNS